jgi:hypothetical protein
VHRTRKRKPCFKGQTADHRKSSLLWFCDRPYLKRLLICREWEGPFVLEVMEEIPQEFSDETEPRRAGMERSGL